MPVYVRCASVVQENAEHLSEAAAHVPFYNGMAGTQREPD